MHDFLFLWRKEILHFCMYRRYKKTFESGQVTSKKAHFPLNFLQPGFKSEYTCTKNPFYTTIESPTYQTK